jgi:hypothetical protein
VNYLIRYHLRLGDIIKCLPAARHLAAQGHKVLFECDPEYFSLFRCVSYAEPVLPGIIYEEGQVKELDLQIWPRRYQDYLDSGKTWWDYVYGMYTELEGIKWSNPFDNVQYLMPDLNPPKNYCLIAPNGYSQSVKFPVEKVVGLAEKLYPDLPKVVVGIGYNNFPGKDGLVSAVACASKVVTINTSVTYIASAFHKDYDHIIEYPAPWGPPDLQNDWDHPAQCRWDLRGEKPIAVRMPLG